MKNVLLAVALVLGMESMIGAVETIQVAVGTTATIIVQGVPSGTEIAIYNAGANEVYIGNSQVSSTIGFAVYPGTTVAFRLAGPLYGVCAGGESATIHVMKN